MIKNLIFDFDGTIVDSRPDIAENLKKAYGIFGIDIGKEIIIGPPLIEMIDLLTPGLETGLKKQIIEKFKEFYDSCGFKNTRLFSNIDIVLKDFRKKRKRLFLATNKRKVPTLRIIDAMKINYFEDIVTIDNNDIPGKDKKSMISYLLKKYSLNKNETAMIGDTDSDMKAAEDNGIIDIAFKNGYENRDFNECSPAYSVSDLLELLNIVQ